MSLSFIPTHPPRHRIAHHDFVICFDHKVCSYLGNAMWWLRINSSRQAVRSQKRTDLRGFEPTGALEIHAWLSQCHEWVVNAHLKEHFWLRRPISLEICTFGTSHWMQDWRVWTAQDTTNDPSWLPGRASKWQENQWTAWMFMSLAMGNEHFA